MTTLPESELSHLSAFVFLSQSCLNTMAMGKENQINGV